MINPTVIVVRWFHSNCECMDMGNENKIYIFIKILGKLIMDVYIHPAKVYEV